MEQKNLIIIKIINNLFKIHNKIIINNEFNCQNQINNNHTSKIKYSLLLLIDQIINK